MQHADAVKNGKANLRKRKAKATGIAAYASLPKHRAFVPLITIWGGLLFALIAAVLPDQAIAQVSSLTGVFLPSLVARLILAFAMGLLGALLGYIVSCALAYRTQLNENDGNLVSTFKSRVVEPINPVTDLGSEGLDAPIDNREPNDEGEVADLGEIKESVEKREPSLGESARRGGDIGAPEAFEEQPKRHKKSEWASTCKQFEDAQIESCEGASCEAASFPAAERVTEDSVPQPEPQTAEQAPTVFAPLNGDTIARRADKPRALELSEFASIPGRDAVWVEEAEVDTANTRTSEPSQAQVPESALEKLRQTPTEDLSLVEMIERFAAALHERQAKERASASEGETAREAALAEALKALALFTDEGFDKDIRPHMADSQIDQTEGELKSALARLQEARGAA